ncbi:MAG: hypothetical protein FD130_640 [Halothiobacillaceae bacterium]|nr:MAG: hypothetical protein FD130_640 [Halothiobacillaceae bacterium]
MVKIESVVLLIGLAIGAFYSEVGRSQDSVVDLGRLFTSAAERQTLSRQREAYRVQSELTTTTALPNTAPERGLDTIIVNGVVQRHHGDSTVWINGAPLNGTQGPENIRIYRDFDQHNSLLVGVPGRRSATLKPGQQLQMESGNITEQYTTETKEGAKPTAP